MSTTPSNSENHDSDFVTIATGDHSDFAISSTDKIGDVSVTDTFVRTEKFNNATNILNLTITREINTIHRSFDSLLGNIDSIAERLNMNYETLINFKIAQNPEYIMHVKYPTQYQCLIALDRDGELIRYMSNPTFEMCMLALSRNGMCLQYIDVNNVASSEEQIKQLYHTAVRNDPCAIQYVDHTAECYNELCEYALCDGRNRKLFKYIVNPSEDMIIDAVKANVENITYVIEDVAGYSETFLIALIKACPNVFKYIHNRIEQTKDIVTAVVTYYGEMIQYVDEKFKTYELECLAVKSQVSAIAFIPKPDVDLCKLAVDIDPGAIHFIDEEFQTDEFCEYFIKNCDTDKWNRVKSCIANITPKILGMRMLKNMGFWRV